mmetsp:Transcript_35729/g.26539  ORF Transcript_35729/g.26539 Transcript_35729/m.26539 type:complete len:381 (+) Transcript_35729:31-1173(+)
MVHKIYVGQLSDQTTEETLRHVFGEFGNVTHVELRTGFAFVSFESEEVMLRSIDEMNNKELDGSRIRVEKERGTAEGGFRDFEGRGRPPKRLDLRVVIRGLHHKVDWRDLKDWARETVGEVTYSNVFDRDGQHMGLIELKDEASVERALSVLADIPLFGMKVTLERDRIDSEYSRIPPSGQFHRDGGRGGDFRHGHRGGRGDIGRGRDFGYDRRDADYHPRDRDYNRSAPPPQFPVRDHSRDRMHRDRGEFRDMRENRDFRDREFREHPPHLPSSQSQRGPPFDPRFPPNDRDRFVPPPGLPYDRRFGDDMYQRGPARGDRRSRSRSRDRVFYPPSGPGVAGPPIPSTYVGPVGGRDSHRRDSRDRGAFDSRAMLPSNRR